MIGAIDLRVDRSGTRTVARLAGEIDLSNAAMLRRAITDAVPNRDVELVVDLSRVRYLDSAGIAMLFDLARRLGEHNQRLTMVVPSTALILRSLEASGWPRELPVLESLDQL